MKYCEKREMGATSKLRIAAKKMVIACASFSTCQFDSVFEPTPPTFHVSEVTCKPSNYSHCETPYNSTTNTTCNSKNLCAICLDPLNYNNSSVAAATTSGGDSSCRGQAQAIFTAECSHAFHFGCISSNVRHGSVTCPICRAHWTQLPRNLIQPIPPSHLNDPILEILDNSIADFRVHRHSFLHSSAYCYNDDDPIDTPAPHLHFHTQPRLQLDLVPLSSSLLFHSTTTTTISSIPHLPPITIGQAPYLRAYLSIKLAHRPPTDLVLVASPNGPHLRLLKQSMALVVFSLRPLDRLAIVTHSSAAARVFPLRRMTSYGKRTALQVIDRLFYMGQADVFEGLKKGMKILEDRAHTNPSSCILHLSDSPTRSYHGNGTEHVPIPIHQFHVGFAFRTSNGLVMHELEEFMVKVLGGMIRETHLKIGDEAEIVRVGELREGEERRILVELDERGPSHICVGYSYIEGRGEECMRRGELVVGLAEDGDKREVEAAPPPPPPPGSFGGRRTSCVETWDYHNPYMARRWAKHLHGYRL